MLRNNEKLVRRQILRCGLVNGLAIFIGGALLLGKDTATAEQLTSAQTNIGRLILALRSTGNAACRSTAIRLEAFRTSSADYDLHLRNAGLRAVDAEIIARAMREFCPSEAPALRSFSMSYNPGLTDAAVEVLAQSFPSTLTELGLVDCAIGDKAGVALLRWGKMAVGLRLLCLEKNHFSAGIRREFASLAKQKINLVVVV